ncbi:MAG: hypothetical protein HQK50_15200 [Oligoflexia bacterium]|nr:hypothetical protein [Oligoflexia bacterium]MBF0366920.1 hypothetical protein [Oligoflexia bacterium]
MKRVLTNILKFFKLARQSEAIKFLEDKRFFGRYKVDKNSYPISAEIRTASNLQFNFEIINLSEDGALLYTSEDINLFAIDYKNSHLWISLEGEEASFDFLPIHNRQPKLWGIKILLSDMVQIKKFFDMVLPLIIASSLKEVPRDQVHQGNEGFIRLFASRHNAILTVWVGDSSEHSEEAKAFEFIFENTYIKSNQFNHTIECFEIGEATVDRYIHATELIQKRLGPKREQRAKRQLKWILLNLNPDFPPRLRDSIVHLVPLHFWE